MKSRGPGFGGKTTNETHGSPRELRPPLKKQKTQGAHCEPTVKGKKGWETGSRKATKKFSVVRILFGHLREGTERWGGKSGRGDRQGGSSRRTRSGG